jgi:hypothetical protein
MGRVGAREGVSVASAADLAALGRSAPSDMTDAVIARMAEITLDLEARRQRDLADTAEAMAETGLR